MSLENERICFLIELHEDANIGVLLTDTIRLAGYNPKPQDGNEWRGVSERWGIVVDAPYMEIPLFQGDMLVIRLLENDPHDNYIDCEIVESEYCEFNGSLSRIPKASFKIVKCMI